MTAVHFRDYALGCVGFIPGTVAFVFIGTTASGLLGDDDDEGEESADSNGTLQLIVGIVGGIATVIAVVLISIYAKRALNKVLEEDRIEQEALERDVESGDADVEQGAEGMPMDQSAKDGARPTAVNHAIRAPA